MTEAIILAGGLGTRLRGAVPDAPKAMAPVAGKPFLTYLLEHLACHGIRRVVLAVGYKSAAIQNFFGLRYRDMELLYSIEDEPLGTGGALVRALTSLEGHLSFVLNGDTFLRLSYQDMGVVMECRQPAELAVAIRRVADATRYATVSVSGSRIRGFHARGTPGPGLINAGCYLVRRDVFARYEMPSKFSFELGFLEPKVADIQPLAYESEAPFIDIGVPEALLEAQTLIPEWMRITG